jgi:hypothetical protein
MCIGVYMDYQRHGGACGSLFGQSGHGDNHNDSI